MSRETVFGRRGLGWNDEMFVQLDLFPPPFCTCSATGPHRLDCTWFVAMVLAVKGGAKWLERKKGGRVTG